MKWSGSKTAHFVDVDASVTEVLCSCPGVHSARHISKSIKSTDVCRVHFFTRDGLVVLACISVFLIIFELAILSFAKLTALRFICVLKGKVTLQRCDDQHTTNTHDDTQDWFKELITSWISKKTPPTLVSVKRLLQLNLNHFLSFITHEELNYIAKWVSVDLRCRKLEEVSKQHGMLGAGRTTSLNQAPGSQ